MNPTVFINLSLLLVFLHATCRRAELCALGYLAALSYLYMSFLKGYSFAQSLSLLAAFLLWSQPSILFVSWFCSAVACGRVDPDRKYLTKFFGGASLSLVAILMAVVPFLLSLIIRTGNSSLSVTVVGMSFLSFSLVRSVQDTVDSYYFAKSGAASGVPLRFAEVYASSVAPFKFFSGPIQGLPSGLSDAFHGNKVGLLAFSRSMLMLSLGIFFKFVVADGFRQFFLADPYMGVTNIFFGSPLFRLFGLPLYGIHLFLDFYGYILIAYGIAYSLGFPVVINFVRPLSASSLTEFWRRWNISLSLFLKDNIFSPIASFLAISAPSAMSLALPITMLICGLWHGVGLGFVVWGVVHGFWLLAESKSKHRSLQLGLSISPGLSRFASSFASSVAMLSILSTFSLFYVDVTEVFGFFSLGLAQFIEVLPRTGLTLYLMGAVLVLVVIQILLVKCVDFICRVEGLVFSFSRIPLPSKEQFIDGFSGVSSRSFLGVPEAFLNLFLYCLIVFCSLLLSRAGQQFVYFAF